ncbi:MAG: aspartate kinase, partial [Oscillospiraceae bacterium]|nr:aspartate kinase [Oscillospiraceae bacterium]
MYINALVCVSIIGGFILSECKVVKFGGSSLADACQFSKVRSIISAESERRYVVPSAPGARFSGDEKVTDLLYKCYSLAENDKPFESVFEKIKERYNGIISGLSLNISLDEEFVKIEKTLRQKTTKDYIASRGEYLNGIILANYLGFDFIDSADVIFFNTSGVFDSEKTNAVLSEELKKHDYAVIPGFYGSLPDGAVKTFSRGGSDITGAIVARAANASIYENWTDVSGFLMADPRIVDSPKAIKKITYHELRELSYMGATVLHEDAIFPVRQAKIPINIKNTNNPSDAGTLIVDSLDDSADSDSIVTGIAGRKGFCSVLLEKDMMNNEIGFGCRALKVFADNNISFEHLPSGIDTLSVVLEQKDIAGREELIKKQLFEA